MPNILQINAVEYYANKDEDDEGIAGKIIIDALQPAVDTEGYIQGPNYIKAKVTATYTYFGAEGDEWSWDEDAPIKVTVDGRTLKVVWTALYTGSFKIKCGDKEKEITVNSLF